MKYCALRFIVVVACILSAPKLKAQSSGWEYLPNVGLPSPTRFEDVYFTDTLTGYAVYLGYFWGPDVSTKPIYKTTDGGANWTLVGPTVYGSSALRSIEFLNDKTTGIVGSLNGSLYRTIDAGANWTDITPALTDTLYLDSLPAGSKKICGIAHIGNNFYAVGWWGAKVARLYKSTDKGISWNTTYIDTNLATSLVDAVFTSIDTGFVAGGRNVSGGSAYTPSDESVILKTTDGGITWTKVFSDTTIGGRIWKIQAIDKMNLVGCIEPYYYPDSVNMVKSTDGGNTWSIIHIGNVVGSVVGYGVNQGLGFASKQLGWVGGYYDGLFQTTDGGVTWDTVKFGNNFNRFFIIDSNHIFAGGQSVYKWRRLPDTATHPGVSVRPVIKSPHILHPVSPNPSSGKVKIEFDLLTETNVVLQVVNVDARRHESIVSGRFKAGHYTYYWDSGDMPSGNYLIWLGTDEVPVTQKFILRK